MKAAPCFIVVQQFDRSLGESLIVSGDNTCLAIDNPLDHRSDGLNHRWDAGSLRFADRQAKGFVDVAPIEHDPSSAKFLNQPLFRHWCVQNHALMPHRAGSFKNLLHLGRQP